MKKLRSRIKEEQFYPGWLGLFVNPFYFARKGLFENIRELSHHVSGRTLDVGCGQKPYESLFDTTEYVGLELDTPENRAGKRADVYFDGGRFPFEDEEFNTIVTFQVFEHVFNPTDFLKEMYRVLNEGGTLLLTAPFVWDEHEQPNDFARYSSFGLKALVSEAGFTVLEQRKSIPDVRVIFQLANDYLFKKALTGHKDLDLLITVIIMSPLNILGEVLSKILPKNDDLYLDNVIVAKKGDHV